MRVSCVRAIRVGAVLFDVRPTFLQEGAGFVWLFGCLAGVVSRPGTKGRVFHVGYALIALPLSCDRALKLNHFTAYEIDWCNWIDRASLIILYP